MLEELQTRYFIGTGTNNDDLDGYKSAIFTRSAGLFNEERHFLSRKLDELMTDYFIDTKTNNNDFDNESVILFFFLTFSTISRIFFMGRGPISSCFYGT